jgi:cation transport regulator
LLTLHPGGGAEANAISQQQRSAAVGPHSSPDHAQDIYREPFNHAYAAHSGERNGERRAHMIAWALVKRSVKAGDFWVGREPLKP